MVLPDKILKHVMKNRSKRKFQTDNQQIEQKKLVASRKMQKKKNILNALPEKEEEPGSKRIDDTKEKNALNVLKQGYVICPSEKRFLLLFNILKKNQNKRVLVLFSSPISTEHHYELLNAIDISVTSIHEKQNDEERRQIFHQFCKSKVGILLCTNIAVRSFNVPKVDWIVQYDPPDKPEEYLQSQDAQTDESGNNVLHILRPEELEFIKYVENSNVSINEFKFSCKDIADVQLKLEKIISNNYFLNKSAREAFRVYINAYDSHNHKKIYNVETLDFAQVAKSFGFNTIPAVYLNCEESKESKHKKRSSDVSSNVSHIKTVKQSKIYRLVGKRSKKQSKN